MVQSNGNGKEANVNEFVPRDSVLKEESNGVRVSIPHVARQLSPADERLVQESIAAADALFEARQRRLGRAAIATTAQSPAK